MASLIKIADIVGIKEMLQNYYKALRNFFANKSEMDVVTTALNDLNMRKIEASDIPASLPASGGNADYATSAGNADTLGGRPASDFILKSEHAGDMFELDDEGYVDSNGDKVYDYCEAKLSWQMRPDENYEFIGNIIVPVPNVEAMIMLADCIKQTVDIKLSVVKNPFFDDYNWKELHWLLRCSRTDNIVYTTKYSITDAEYPTVIDSEQNAYFPPTTIEIAVSCNKTPGNGARYVQITIENKYGRAYYTSVNFKKQIIKS